MQVFKCTACQAQGRFAGRGEALAAGWALATVETVSALRYYVLCPKCRPSTAWLKLALGGLAEKPK